MLKVELFRRDGNLSIFFVEQSGVAVCLVCNDKMVVMKDYDLKCHYETRHKSFSEFDGRMREEKFFVLKTNLAKQQNFFQRVQNTVSRLYSTFNIKMNKIKVYLTV
jgi:hypothetical protein